ncbi:MAG: DNA polymerase IV [Gammaproteobacteria bacterium]|nr:DNA polymerase IV [Gammaproteobacteria bacterium]
MRKILHIDMDAFFASVEQRDNPSLRGKPVIVGGKPDSRGVVAACSYEARVFGVRSAMPCAQAAKLCKDAIFVPHRFDAYREASAQIHEVFREFADEIEPLSLDEAYLDVTESAKKIGSATEVAIKIKQGIKDKTKLVASAGVSYNKFLAKIASDMDKPDGMFVIRPDQAEQFIAELDIRKFYGVGKVTEQKMHRLGIFKGADLKTKSLDELKTLFGKSGQYYFNVARGVDNRPVKSSRRRKSIGAEATFETNVVDKNVIWERLLQLLGRVEATMKKKSLKAHTVTIKVKYSDFTLITRSQTVIELLADKDQLTSLLPMLLKKTDVGIRPIRLIGVSVSKLVSVEEQKQEGILKSELAGQQMGLF